MNTYIGRRRALKRLVGGGAAFVGLHGAVWAQGRTLRIGTTLDATGPEKANGLAMHQGSTAFINALNRSGGINGTKVELLLADDKFNVDAAKNNALAFRADPSVVALLHRLGTRQTAAMMDAFQDLAIVGPFTGTAGLRKKPSPNTFWVRASYDHEIEKLISTAVTLGINQIGLVHPKDPLGAGLLAAFNAACERHKVKPAVIATTPNTVSTEVEPAAQEIAKASPQVVLMGLAAGAAPHFVRALRKAGGKSSSVYGLSIAMSAQSIRELGELSHGVGFSIIVPSPFAAKYEVVRRYQADMTASGFTDLSLPSLECYIDAAVLVEGMRRAGGTPTRASIIAGLEQLDAFDVGGLRVHYGKGVREGSRFVDVAVIGKEGKFLS
jgi:ABC-type branched-subunit amino acid transport system substrate-binding protein